MLALALPLPPSLCNSETGWIFPPSFDSTTPHLPRIEERVGGGLFRPQNRAQGPRCCRHHLFAREDEQEAWQGLDLRPPKLSCQLRAPLPSHRRASRRWRFWPLMPSRCRRRCCRRCPHPLGLSPSCESGMRAGGYAQLPPCSQFVQMDELELWHALSHPATSNARL